MSLECPLEVVRVVICTPLRDQTNHVGSDGTSERVTDLSVLARGDRVHPLVLAESLAPEGLYLVPQVLTLEPDVSGVITPKIETARSLCVPLGAKGDAIVHPHTL